ncbi:MAG: recombinase family protein [Flexilinea sp.]|nr:recombinase family protein [Flexilinea sp.]
MSNDKFDAKMTDELSNDERKLKISEATADSKHKAAAEGYFLSSRAPFGYRKGNADDPDVEDSRILIVDEPAAAAVRKCFEWYASGEWTYEMIARALNDQGFLTTMGKPFSRETIRQMLCNQTYLGKIVYRKTDVYRGKHLPLVDQDLWNKANHVE